MWPVLEKHKIHWTNKFTLSSTLAALLLLLVSFVVNYYANVFATSHISNYVSDVILDNLPVLNVDFIFFEGFFIFWIFVTLILVEEPKKAPFTVKSIATFIIIRSFFISLTHLGPPPVHSYIEPSDFFSLITSGNDMFFSSHTGLPFLMSLIFWDNKYLRYIFVLASILFAASVLFGHLHYSIDVFAAYFITHGIYLINKRFYSNDYKAFIS